MEISFNGCRILAAYSPRNAESPAALSSNVHFAANRSFQSAAREHPIETKRSAKAVRSPALERSEKGGPSPLREGVRTLRGRLFIRKARRRSLTRRTHGNRITRWLGIINRATASFIASDEGDHQRCVQDSNGATPPPRAKAPLIGTPTRRSRCGRKSTGR